MAAAVRLDRAAFTERLQSLKFRPLSSKSRVQFSSFRFSKQKQSYGVCRTDTVGISM